MKTKIQEFLFIIVFKLFEEIELSNYQMKFWKEIVRSGTIKLISFLGSFLGYFVRSLICFPKSIRSIRDHRSPRFNLFVFPEWCLLRVSSASLANWSLDVENNLSHCFSDSISARTCLAKLSCFFSESREASENAFSSSSVIVLALIMIMYHKHRLLKIPFLMIIFIKDYFIKDYKI